MKWLGLAVFAALPLQWFVVGNTPLGLTRLHQAVLLMVVLIIAVVRPMRSNTVVVGVALPFIVLNVLMLGVWSAVSLFNGEIPRSPIQELVYLGVFIIFGSYLARAATGAEPGALALLRWAAPVAALTLIIAFGLSMLGNGVNPIAVLQHTIAAADPEVLQKELFKSSFVGYGYDSDTVRGNIRHEVFGAVLAAMYVSVWAEGLLPGGGNGRRLRRIGLIVCAGMLLISMSRAVLIAAAVWPLLALFRSAWNSSITRRQLTIFYTAVIGLGALVVTGVAGVIWVRFTQDTQSYESRGGLYDQAFSNIRDNFWTGGVETASESSHNFVVDAWLHGGFFVAVLAAGVLVVLLLSWARSVIQLPNDPVWMLPIAAAFALPIDRMLTAGGGLIPPVSWVTLSIVAGAFAFKHAQKQEGPVEREVPRPAPVG